MRLAKSPERTARDAERREFLIVYWTSFVAFLAVAILARLLPPGWRPFPSGVDGSRSILGDARAAANMTIPFAFMP